MDHHPISELQGNLHFGEGLLICSNANRFYYTGFSSSAGMLLVSKESADFFIDFRYYEKAKATISGCHVILAGPSYEGLRRQIERYGIKTLYVETGTLSIDMLKRYGDGLPGVAISMEDTFDRLIKKQRSIKTEAEIQNIMRAQQITDDTFTYILNRIQPGKTEREVMLDMEFYLRRQGSEGVSFDFIVVSGKNSSLPHGVPSDKKIETGDFITMDFGAVVGGYRSDMTRTVAVGRPNERQRTVYQTVLEAQQAALQAIRAGKVCKDIDHVARSLIDQRGYAGCFGHGLGHSVGIEIHEQPCLNLTDETILQPGMIMTVEPGIYLENEFGVRIEDMVAVTENGYRNLTASPKDLIIL